MTRDSRMQAASHFGISNDKNLSLLAKTIKLSKLAQGSTQQDAWSPTEPLQGCDRASTERKCAYSPAQENEAQQSKR